MRITDSTCVPLRAYWRTQTMKRLSQPVLIFALAMAVVVTSLSAEVCPVAKNGPSGRTAIAAMRQCLPEMMCCPSTSFSSSVECVGPHGVLMGFARRSDEPSLIAFGHVSRFARTSLDQRDHTCSANSPGLEGSPGSSALDYLCSFRPVSYTHLTLPTNREV